MKLVDAKKEILAILSALRRDDALEALEFCDTVSSFLSNAPEDEPLRVPSLAELDAWVEAREELAMFAHDIKDRLESPLATFADERILFPAESESSEFADMSAHATIHVDGFLYDDDDIDELCDEGALARYRCKQCNSSEHLQPLDYISHSMSRDTLEYLFLHFFRDSDRTFLDIGCRTGAVLAAAALYTRSPRIAGIELSSSWSALAAEALRTHFPAHPIEVHAGDVHAFPELVRASHVTVLNNVFEFFADLPAQRELWSYLAGQWTAEDAQVEYLVTVPALEKQWATCGWDDAELLRAVDEQFVLMHSMEADVMELAVYRRRRVQE